MEGRDEGPKRAAARAAVERLVRPGQRLALGTGSTAAWAIREIADRPALRGLDCVASSRATERLAASLGLTVRPPAEDDRFDLMLDGADEVDPALDLTKGGGGALFREKLLATLSEEVAILVDPEKLVPALGTRHPIPVEVVPFARPSLVRRFSRGGFRVELRAGADGRPFVTDNGNEILDLMPAAPLASAGDTARALRAEVGVVETGLFVGIAARLFVGRADGSVEERRRPPTRR